MINKLLESLWSRRKQHWFKPMLEAALKQLEQLRQDAMAALSQAKTAEELEAVRVAFLGKQGAVTEIMKTMSQCQPHDRPRFGQAINALKQTLQQHIQEAVACMEAAAAQAKIAREQVDITLPGAKTWAGSLHPLTHVYRRVIDIFKGFGFSVVQGLEVEDDFHNFTALNVPANHPARGMQDTFYLEDGKLLRTQTSTVQIRVMETHRPPFRIIAPGRVYRCDSDHTHTPMFNQLEALVVNKDCHFGELKAMLGEFLNRFFEKQLTVRFRPSYFPFTEPSAEVDIQCTHCSGQGCRICSGTGWLEVLGCGMVHPNVFRAVQIDPSQWMGYAFGVGLDRLAMLLYQIPDLRFFFTNDVRFLEQFPG